MERGIETAGAAVEGGGEFQGLGVEVKAVAIEGASIAVAVEAVAEDGHTEAGSRGRVYAQLMRAAGQRMKHYAAMTVGNGQEFIISHGILAGVEVYALARTIQPVGRQRQLYPPFLRDAPRLIVTFQVGYIRLLHLAGGEQELQRPVCCGTESSHQQTGRVLIQPVNHLYVTFGTIFGLQPLLDR